MENRPRTRLSTMAKESLSTQLVKDLEEFQGLVLQIAPRQAGFNGLAVRNGNVIRKIEIKSVDKSDNWFAINGLRGIECLFFDPQYYLYFVLIRERKIVVAKAMPFLQTQIPTYNPDVGDDMRRWLDLTKAISTESGLNIIPRVNFKLRVGIRTLVEMLESNRDADTWTDSIESIWSFEEPDSWRMTYPSIRQLQQPGSTEHNHAS
jgi:hypothetical protein